MQAALAGRLDPSGPTVQVGQVGVDLLPGDGSQAAAPFGQPAREQGEIGPVGAQGVPGETVGQPEGVDEFVQERRVSVPHG